MTESKTTGQLRRLLLESEGQETEPTACIIDSQGVKTSTNVPAAGQGTDLGKKTIGRKRYTATDAIGLLPAVLDAAASVQDGGAAPADPGLGRLAHRPQGMGRHGLQERRHRTRRHTRIDVEIVRHDPTTRGFVVQPRRWVVERTLGWPMNRRRLAPDCEALPARSEAVIYVAMIRLIGKSRDSQTKEQVRGSIRAPALTEIAPGITVALEGGTVYCPTPRLQRPYAWP
ncbi:transposase [Streptomyces microflavus]|uniref:transposase n=1 Tax=Streptomyces microflavus TaxID=1919 RepID=UPI0034466AC3